MTSLGTISTDTNSATFDGIFSKLREIDSSFIGNGVVSVETTTSFVSGRPPMYLFDGSQGTYYHSAQASEKVITIDFHQNSFLLTKYVMQRFLNTAYNPSSWIISGFQGESSIPICSNDSFPISLNYEAKLYHCQSTYVFNKFELRLAQKGTGQNNNVAFSELEFFGILNPIIIPINNTHANTNTIMNIHCISPIGFVVIIHLYHFTILGFLF